MEEGIGHYREALKLRPAFPAALNNLAWILAANLDPQLRNGPEAVKFAEQACQLTESKEPLLVGTLAAAYAEAGRFPEAIQLASRALEFANNKGDKTLADVLRSRLKLYQANLPYHESP